MFFFSRDQKLLGKLFIYYCIYILQLYTYVYLQVQY